MGSLVQIRNVPDDVRRALKSRAAARGESLNSYLLDVVTREVERPTVAEVLERAGRRAERADISSVEIVAEARMSHEHAPRAPPRSPVIVVDAAAVVDALAGVAGADDLCARMAVEELHAPELLDYEVLSAVRSLCLGGHLSRSRAADLLTDFDDLSIQRWPLEDPLRRRVFELRDCVSAYDAAYIALAEALGCRLLTRDARLARAGGHGAQVEVL